MKHYETPVLRLLSPAVQDAIATSLPTADEGYGDSLPFLPS